MSDPENEVAHAADVTLDNPLHRAMAEEIGRQHGLTPQEVIDLVKEQGDAPRDALVKLHEALELMGLNKAEQLMVASLVIEAVETSRNMREVESLLRGQADKPS